MSQPTGKIRKQKSRRKKDVELKRAVVRMLRVMETPTESGPGSGHDASSEFLVTGRTGRRNALPDILGHNAQTTCSDLPDQLQSLCSVAPGSSTSQNTNPSNNDPTRSPSSPSSATTNNNNNSVSAS